MKHTELNGISRRHFAMVGLTAGAAMLTPGALFSEGIEPLSSKSFEADLPTIKPGTNTSFTALKQIDAGLLNVGYAEAGPANGPAVILLHGWPYDIYSFVDVAPLLASAGYRVVVPYLRGYGSTRFLSGHTLRNGQPSAVAVDVIALLDALRIEKATIGGFDWGGRTADIIAILWPERCTAGSGTTSTGATFRSSSGGLPRRSGTSTTPRSIAPRLRSTTRTTSPSSSTIIGSGSDWPKANRSTTIWKSGSRRVRSSAYPPSPSKATPTERRTRRPVRTPGNSPANMRTGPLPAASGTICLRRLRKPSPRRSSTLLTYEQNQPAEPLRASYAT